MECRGLEPTGVHYGPGFRCKSSESSSEYHEVNLEENEWVEYDDKASVSVGIYDVQFNIIKEK